MDLLIVGTIGFDTVETPLGKSEKALGGTALFGAVAASYFGRPGVVAIVGTDFPEEHIAFLKEKNVGLDGLVQEEGESFHWGAKYHTNMNKRDTLFTHLNVFEKFSPEIPAAYRNTPNLFLGNISPDLQLHVLDQVKSPEIVALDTMNYWIERTPEDLRRVLEKVEIILINDEEALQLSGAGNLVQAIKEIEKMGPGTIIIKKGEHGALLAFEDELFYAPAFPLEVVSDPTGAGDTFAGGFLGYLARAKKMNAATLRRAMIYGSAMASFVVEDFSVNRLKNLSEAEIQQRFDGFHQLTFFEKEE